MIESLATEKFVAIQKKVVIESLAMEKSARIETLAKCFLRN
jgi:hypothetical protein